ncbi:MAG TPA: (d)CMP kinase [Salinivirgaceae bacterium]|nr:(d)CMP kinase [Salinivirgaceae bacterium]HQA76030.1 (d)CMP kinase [Salinivirgaceae bacterium]
MKNIVIAVDGFSSCGKSTLAKDIAKELELIYIDTGAMYRGATLLAMEHNLIHNNVVDEDKLIEILKSTSMVFKKVGEQVQLYLNDRNVENEIRSMEVSNNVSPVSTIAEVRNILVDRQRELGKSMNVILDGRDIGTVVFPNADIKLFLTASPEIRAQRRYDEMKKKGDNVTLSEVANNIQNRDFIDQNREVSPLKKADDAYVIDNSNMSKQEQLQHAISIIKLKRPDIFEEK